MTVLCSVCLQLGLDPPGHGETGSSQREELPPSDWPGLHRYNLPSSVTAVKHYSCFYCVTTALVRFLSV